MKFFITAGGTGGHIYPALALYKELKERGHDVFFICSRRDRRFDDVEQLDFSRITIPAAPFARKNLFKNFKTLWVFTRAYLRCRNLIKTLKPDVCIGFGGYVTAPVLFASRMKKVPYVIFEQNAFPGLANRVFSGRAAAIILNFEAAKEKFKKSAKANCVVLGNPVRSGFTSVSKTEARKFFGLTAKDKVLGVIGGSQGALSINNSIAGIASKLNGIKLLWGTGVRDYEQMKKKNTAKNVSIFSFIERMDYFLAACDLVISRAGASSLSEIAVTSTPSILVPYPFAAADHQMSNALVFEKFGASVVIEDKPDLEDNLRENITGLFSKRNILSKMKIKAGTMYKPGTMVSIAGKIEGIGAAHG
ncbi:MAG: undecaprenyldiphospho-muramoylpentapeptide beta-N-acetylglucosaminyltransferase [Spirochaetes bacterium]|nr:undecaprenyldiphospho-muramoylpentapeptide beta-N-acetylglucosaminyltransferase [Spirochaetota bacterium]